MNRTTQINVAPLVDVFLVLVVIFMITAPILTAGINVDLPKTKAVSSKQEDKAPVIISIDKDSNIYVEDAKVSIEELLQKLPLIMENGKSDVVYIRGDKNLQYGTIMEIMGIISSSGACKVSLISEVDTNASQNNNLSSIKFDEKPIQKQNKKLGHKNNKRK